MAVSKDDLKARFASHRQIKINVIGRKPGTHDSIPV
jgi:hypothetical protein